MDLPNRNKSVAELRKDNNKLITAVMCIAIAALLIAAKSFFQSDVVINQVPGMPDGAKIERNGMDAGAMQAYAYAVTNALASINPSNGDSVKKFVQPFLSPACFTKVSQATEMAERTSSRYRHCSD